MKLGKELRVVLVGLVVSFMTLLIGFLAKPAEAIGCKSSGSCTYYDDNGNGYSGNCGTYNNLCVCSFQGNHQAQAACGGPPAP